MIKFFQTMAVSRRPVGANANGVGAVPLTRGCARFADVLDFFSAMSAAFSSNAVSAFNTHR